MKNIFKKQPEVFLDWSDLESSEETAGELIDRIAEEPSYSTPQVEPILIQPATTEKSPRVEDEVFDPMEFFNAYIQPHQLHPAS